MSPGTCAPTPETKIKLPYPTVLLKSGVFFALGLRPKTRLVGLSWAAAGTAAAAATAPAFIPPRRNLRRLLVSLMIILFFLPFGRGVVRRSIARRRTRRARLSPPVFRPAQSLRT